MSTTDHATAPKLKPEFLVERQGKQFVLYAGLLDLAHQQGLRDITIEIVQLPTEANGNVAVVLARVTVERGTFTEVGDTAPTNVNRMMAPHLLRMAATRAKARALRDAVNIGVTALEELGGNGEAEDDDAPPRQRASAARPPARERHVEAPGDEPAAAWPSARAAADASAAQVIVKKTPRAYYDTLVAIAQERQLGREPEVVTLAPDAPDDFITEKGKALKARLQRAGVLDAKGHAVPPAPAYQPAGAPAPA